MSVHYNVQIHVQRVEKGETTRGALGQESAGKRDVTEVLDVKVTADSEAQAYEKVRRILAANVSEVHAAPAPAGYASGWIMSDSSQ